MYKEVKLFTEPEELLSWAAEKRHSIQISREDAELLLKYLKGHDYAVGKASNGDMVRINTLGDVRIVEEYSLDDLIDRVSEWNYEMIVDADTKRKNPANFLEFANEQNRYQNLLEEEKKIDSMFAQTSYGKHIELVARELAGELIKTMEKEQSLEECVKDVADCIRSSIVENRGRSR